MDIKQAMDNLESMRRRPKEADKEKFSDMFGMFEEKEDFIRRHGHDEELMKDGVEVAMNAMRIGSPNRQDLGKLKIRNPIQVLNGFYFFHIIIT